MKLIKSHTLSKTLAFVKKKTLQYETFCCWFLWHLTILFITTCQQNIEHWPSYCTGGWSLALYCRSQVHPQASQCGVCGGKSGNGTGFSPKIWLSPISIIPPMFHTYSFICHWCHIFSAIDSIIKYHNSRKTPSVHLLHMGFSNYDPASILVKAGSPRFVQCLWWACNIIRV